MLALKRLPRTINEAYDEMFSKIHTENSDSNAKDVGGYLWLLAGRTELAPVTTLYEVAAQEHLSQYTPKDLAARSCGFLRYDPKDQNLQFLHPTARDYILFCSPLSANASNAPDNA